MRLNKVQETAPLGTTFRFVPLGDFHLGSLSCDEGTLRRTIQDIADDPLARWIGMGDLLESIAPDDKRWNPKAVLPEAKQEQAAIGDWYVEKLCSILDPIMDKCWGLCDGNHEDAFNKRYFTNINKRVLHEYGLEDLYGEWACATKVQFEDDNNHRRVLKFFQQHGWQAGRKKGAKINSLEDLCGYMEGCHIYLVAHSHERFVVPFTALGFNQQWTDFEVYDCYGAHTGSFLKTYQKDVVCYGEKRGYRPTSLGTVEFKVTTGQTGVKVRAVI
uniref:Calcineurin-like phosphoesterase n=1 Tax=viral metagenome TaxID=1070528 RepID=A0A6M3KCI3_9ZZZZ